jgi:phosphatidylglycerol:prolipoprotein diacylglycerol transferase
MQAPDRVAFSLFGLDIMWYGILVTAGIAFVVFIICKRAPSYGYSSDRALNYALVLLPFGIIGLRLYYVVFNWDFYKDDLSSIFDLRSGGLAIHGGLILGTLAFLIMSTILKDRKLSFLDLSFSAIPLGQAIGRWGNFFNQEAYGTPTDLPWAIVIDGEKVHPTFLYESIWCLLLFVILSFLGKRRSFEGQIVLLYVILYSVERFFVEGLRTDSLMLMENLRQAQVVSAIAIVLGIVFYIILSRRRNNEIGNNRTSKRR